MRILILAAVLLLCSCVNQPAVTTHDIKPGDVYYDLGKPITEENSYTIVKVDGNYVYDKDFQGVIHRVSVNDLKAYCISAHDLPK